MSTKRAAKLDMDDRAKIVQYFTRPVNGAGDISPVQSVRIEEMFGKCWSVPSKGPSLPTIITVQAPAGIGKTSMLKYMCMKWGCQELWTDNFDVLLFVECRTLNRYVVNFPQNVLMLCYEDDIDIICLFIFFPLNILFTTYTCVDGPLLTFPFP